MNISCVIPTYNGVELLKKHLPSIVASLEDGDELIIADDSSTDNSVEWLTSHFKLKKAELTLASGIPSGYQPVPNAQSVTLFSGNEKHQEKSIGIKVLQYKENMRFAAAVNGAVCLVKNSFFLLLNNDVSVEKRTVSILKKKSEENLHIFAIGCLEYENDKTGKKSGKNKLWFERGLFQHSKADNFDSGETAWASGGSAFFSTEKWFKLKGFDRDFYPAYWEDIDLSHRARKRGWKVLFDSDAVVYHKHESTNQPVFGTSGIEAASWKNAFLFAWKHSNIVQKASVLFWYPYWQMQRVKHG